MSERNFNGIKCKEILAICDLIKEYTTYAQSCVYLSQDRLDDLNYLKDKLNTLISELKVQRD